MIVYDIKVDKELAPIEIHVAVEKFLTGMAKTFITTIKDRTAQGKDVDGNAWSASSYNKKYAKYRDEIGKAIGPFGSWLFLTGQMLKSLAFWVEDEAKVVIGFAGTRILGAPKVKRWLSREKTITGGRIKKTRGTRGEVLSQLPNESITNSMVAYGVEVGGPSGKNPRHFFGVNKQEVEDAVAKCVTLLEYKTK